MWLLNFFKVCTVKVGERSNELIQLITQAFIPDVFKSTKNRYKEIQCGIINDRENLETSSVCMSGTYA